jgi:hypothetical protein
MQSADIEEQLRGARLEVDGAIRLLVSASPDSLDRCAGILERAGRRLAGVQPQLQPGGGASVASTHSAREEARRLQTSVTWASRLLESAASFHLNWSRMRDTLCAGYTPCGQPAPPSPRSRISIRG